MMSNQNAESVIRTRPRAGGSKEPARTGTDSARLAPRPAPRRISDSGLSVSGGFTLLELLLAVGIFALILLAIHGVFYSAIKLRNKTAESLERQVPLQNALSVIKHDLSNLVVPGGTFSGALQTTPTATTTLGTGSMTALGAGNTPSGPMFYTAAGVINSREPWGDIERVYYYLAPPTNNVPGKDLFRAVTRNLLPVAQVDTESQYLMGGVDSINFEFYDGTAWKDTWDSTATDTATGLTNNLPTAIKVEIQLASTNQTRFQLAPVELVVPVMVQALSNQVAQASSSSGGGQ